MLFDWGFLDFLKVYNLYCSAEFGPVPLYGLVVAFDIVGCDDLKSIFICYLLSICGFETLVSIVVLLSIILSWAALTLLRMKAFLYKSFLESLWRRAYEFDFESIYKLSMVCFSFDLLMIKSGLANLPFIHFYFNLFAIDLCGWDCY